MPIALVLLLSTALFVSGKGNRVLATLFAVDLGAGPLEVGLLYSLHGLFPFLLVIFAGRVADRVDNRVLMYCGIAGVTVALALPFLFPSLPVLFLSVALNGLTSMLFVVATQNLVGVLSTAQSRTRSYSWYSLGESIAFVIGPVFVGFAIDEIRHPLTYLCLALYTAAWGVVLYAKRNAIPPATRAEDENTPRQIRDLLKLPALRNALVTNGAVMAGLDMFNLYLPVYARGLGISASVIGLIIGAFAAAGIVTRLAIPPISKRWGEQRMLAAALVLGTVAFAAFPLLKTPWPLAAASFALGLGLGCGQPLSMILSYNASPPGRGAEGIALRLAVSYGSHLIIPPAFGALGGAIGIAPVFYICAALLGGGAWLNRRRPRDDLGT